jgi:hypothetical protein
MALDGPTELTVSIFDCFNGKTINLNQQSTDCAGAAVLSQSSPLSYPQKS